MFWGLIMEPGRCYTQEVKVPFHISMAALDVANAKDEPSQVMCVYEGRNYLLCTLAKKDQFQCPLDLNFEVGTKISFAVNGSSHVHLTGYLTGLDDDMFDEEEGEEEEGADEQEQVDEKPKKKKKLKKVQDNEEEEPPKKKTKTELKLLSSPLVKQLIETADEDESDDDDFELDEASDEEEDGDEEEAGEEEDEDEEDSDEEMGEAEAEDEEVSSLSDDDEEVEEEQPQQAKTKGAKPKQNGVAAKKEKPAATPKKGEQQKQEKTPKEKKQQQPQQQKGKKQTLKSGVVVEDLRVGNGDEAKTGKFVHVYYEGRLKDNNKMFDSTTKGPGFRFRLGKGEVIKGWDIGVVGMKVGGKRRIVCPAPVAYGQKGSPPVIPPNATLVFDVELKKIN